MAGCGSKKKMAKGGMVSPRKAMAMGKKPVKMATGGAVNSSPSNTAKLYQQYQQAQAMGLGKMQGSGAQRVMQGNLGKLGAQFAGRGQGMPNAANFGLPTQSALLKAAKVPGFKKGGCVKKAKGGMVKKGCK